MKKVIGKIVIILLVFILLLIGIVIGVRLYNKWKTTIKTENGIEESIYVKIGGIEQSLQIRGENQNNPIILFLHGGPGFPISYLSHVYQGYFEDEYTIVHWDQRNAGRTYYKNQNVEMDINSDIMISDTNQVVDYLMNRFEQEKIIILGQSWGTVLGMQYAQLYPNKVQAYIGVGQVIDFDEGKIAAVEEAIPFVIEKKELEHQKILEDYVEEFKTIDSVENININHLVQMIGTSVAYLKGERELSAFEQIWNGVTSPSLNYADLKWYLIATNTEKLFAIEKPLINYMYFEFDALDLEREYEVPMYFISGGNDWITPYGFVKDYCERIDAPDKKYIEMEGTGHTPFLDQPKEFSDKIKDLLKD